LLFFGREGVEMKVSNEIWGGGFLWPNPRKKEKKKPKTKRVYAKSLLGGNRYRVKKRD
jgi:hypothetical protein